MSLAGTTCWVCGSRRARAWKARSLEQPLTSDDLKITDSRYGTTLALFKCAECGFIFADGQELANLLRLYEDLTDDDYETTQPTRALQMKWLLQRVRPYQRRSGSMVDIGAGTGLLVAEAAALGMDAIGIEPSRRLVDIARSLNRIVLQGTLPHPDLGGRKFDLVTLVDVIEHVNQPVAILRQCAEILADDGLLVVVTPDVSSVAARLLGGRWWHFRLAHVGYFDRDSLERAARAADLRLVAHFRPKWFFPVDYIAARLERYLPVAGLNRLARRVPILRRLYRSVVALNPRDSLVTLLRLPAST